MSAKTSPSEQLYQEAKQLIAQQEIEAAKLRLEKIIEESPIAEAAYDLGKIYRRRGDNDNAIKCFEKTVELDPAHAEAYSKAAEIFVEQGLVMPSLGCYGHAIKADPGNTEYKNQFSNMARGCRFKTYNEELQDIYYLCLSDRDVDFSAMGSSWFSLICSNPEFSKLWKKLKKAKPKGFYKKLQKIKDISALYDPFFLTGLQRQVRVPRVEFETFLTNMRGAFLECILNDNLILPEDKFIAISEALARYIYSTDYVMYVPQDEKDKLVQIIEDHSDSVAKIALIGCYQPLHELSDAKEIEKKHKESGIRELIRLQLTEHFHRLEVKETIESLIQTEDNVSARVKDQYEQAPYPRWVNFARMMYEEKVEGYLKDKKARILVAGCGTGHEAIELAYIFPKAEVLAIDLSYSSLAYGKSKAEEYGIKNITFKQADILGLGCLEDKFDYIASSGVLHHMEKPEAGWDVLTNLLKPQGLMRIALYSKPARDSISHSQTAIEKKGLGDSDDDIREFRHIAKKILKKKDYLKITNYIDYFALHECRDLLFHVHEDAFELPRIKKYIQKAGLDFIGFYIDDQTLMKYRMMFPTDPMANNLDNWAMFEDQFPDTFVGMYRLWIKKR